MINIFLFVTASVWVKAVSAPESLVLFIMFISAGLFFLRKLVRLTPETGVAEVEKAVIGTTEIN